MQDRFKLRVWSNKEYKYLADSDIWEIFESDAEDVWELLSEVNRPSNNFLEKQLREYKLTFEQCTGLKDKNGKLIYEGDIVRFSSRVYDLELSDCRAKVEFVHGYFNPVAKLQTNNMVIIGNIHENPELLEGNKYEI